MAVHLTSLQDHSLYLNSTEYLDSEKWKFHIKRVNFGLKTLELWMFIPCDEKGNILKGKPLSPNTDDEWIRWENEEFEFYKAKDKVLFKGFEIVRTYNLDSKNPCYVVSNGVDEVTFHIGLYNFSKGVRFARIIEDLIHINPTLTRTAISELKF